MRQKVHPDRQGTRAWDINAGQTVNIHLTSPAMYAAITGRLPPPTPVTAASYTQAGFPWFSLYDDDKVDDIRAPAVLAAIRSISMMRDSEDVKPLPCVPTVIPVSRCLLM